jgi:hypothetical protein
VLDRAPVDTQEVIDQVGAERHLQEAGALDAVLVHLVGGDI